MKQYTHAWLAMMAMKRIEYATLPEKQQDDAKALITWFKNYRDLVLQGSWYPDMVFKDMASSHIAKYYPFAEYEQTKGKGIDAELAEEAGNAKKVAKTGKKDPYIKVESDFRKMPSTLRMCKWVKKSPKYNQPYIQFKRHNLCDRCESFAESIIDSFKILMMENRGAPVVASNNHIAMRFFILSHYIADAHMPLHCDARSFCNSNEVHTFIEKEWDEMVRAAYKIDEDNSRFFYDSEGYPLFNEGVDPAPLIKYVEKEAIDRKFDWTWGEDNNNTWDYMSGITQHSYLMAYDLIPADRAPKDITEEYYKSTEAYQKHFQKYSEIILGDAVDSIAKVWLHAWCRYRSWFRDHELAILNEELTKAENNYNWSDSIIDSNPTLIGVKQTAIEKAEETLRKRQEAVDEAIAKGKEPSKTQKDNVASSTRNLERLKGELEKLESDLDKAVSYYDIYEAIYIATMLQVKSKEAEIAKYGKTDSI